MAFTIVASPTLMIHRTGDRLTPVSGARYTAAHIPGARFVELPGDDHLFFVGDQDAVLEEIEGFLTGVRPSPEPDRVLATVLFTDIVGSTERAVELGDRRWRELLEGHCTVVRHELARFRGREINTAGDGFFATFDGPARAIRCACAISDAVRARSSGASSGFARYARRTPNAIRSSVCWGESPRSSPERGMRRDLAQPATKSS